MLPTLALIKHEKTVDYVVGFDDMGGKDDFNTQVRLSCSWCWCWCVSRLHSLAVPLWRSRALAPSRPERLRRDKPYCGVACMRSWARSMQRMLPAVTG